MRHFCHLPIVFLFAIIISCKEDSTSSEVGQIQEKYDIKIGDCLLKLELAKTSNERKTGLMHRDKLNAGEGMIFVFETPQPRRFWMKNTRIPLDIGYFTADGRLLELHRGLPYDLSGMPSKSNNLQFVVELGIGEFSRLGIKLGDRIDLQMLAEAITYSGGFPRHYNLHGYAR
ncbi:MAG: DUF192 domain-containing protein [Opitutales bacterium]|nr:DUF192 domain-containing protein [Opitutales bacterium]